ncbi:MAG: hypothetical protein EZS28_011771 [Streblomastix strix]|uniref:Uncharacterized protein n=1 Tax=Streblomastix strix TaxID=222440 RepID=A0A5J4WDX1_9EUKA|nr:MAG: hypothetical protein EZS28_011771 [Streblomastix strix]
MNKSEKQIQDMKKEIKEEDRLRLQSIDQALRNLSTQQQETKQDDMINQPEVKSKRQYNKNKYQDVERETAQVEPKDVVKNTFIAHPNLEVLNVIDNVLFNSVGKLFRVNKDLVRLSDKPQLEVDPNEF